ncbi:MAG: hypothetical protein U0894_08780 [Pirellulales bacterium]
MAIASLPADGVHFDAADGSGDADLYSETQCRRRELLPGLLSGESFATLGTAPDYQRRQVTAQPGAIGHA